MNDNISYACTCIDSVCRTLKDYMIIQSCTVLPQFPNKCTVHELVHRTWVSIIWAVKPLQTPAGIGCFPYMKLDTYMKPRFQSPPISTFHAPRVFACGTLV